MATSCKAHHGRQSYHSINLYQIFAYLKNTEKRGEPHARAEGLLLYPTTDSELEDAAAIQGHRIRNCTIDLAPDWTGIRDDHFRLSGAAFPAALRR